VYLATPGFCAATQRREITLGLRLRAGGAVCFAAKKTGGPTSAK
jgi:hypothetical protein